MYSFRKNSFRYLRANGFIKAHNLADVTNWHIYVNIVRSHHCISIKIFQKTVNGGSLGSARISNQKYRPLYLHHLLQEPTSSCGVSGWY